MIKLIIGKKGSGKTKLLVEMVNEAKKNSKGNVVCIEKNDSLKYEIKTDVRLVRAVEYSVDGYDKFFGFLAGIMAGDYDCTEIFVDSITKICGKDDAAMTAFFEEVEKQSVAHDTNVIVSVSAGLEEIPAALHKYIVNQ